MQTSKDDTTVKEFVVDFSKMKIDQTVLKLRQIRNNRMN